MAFSVNQAKHQLFRIATLTAMVSLAACASVAPPRYCQGSGFLIDANYPAGNFYSCEITGSHTAELLIKPEDAPPINQSPWYSFRISRRDAMPATVTLRFEDGYARYLSLIHI